MEGQNLSLLVAFGAGVLSFISPCVLPLVPVYISHLAGSAVATAEGSPAQRATFLHALSFVVGFSLVFIALGASMGLIGSLVAQYMPILRRIVGAVLILLGIHMTGILKIPFLYREKRLSYSGGTAPGYLRSFLVGAAFSIGWTPCVGPILGSIFALAWSTTTVWRGAYLLAAYSAGLGVPFLAAGLALSPVSRHLKRLNRYLNAVSIVSGLLLIAVGALILTDKLVQLNQYFNFTGQGVLTR